VIKEYRDRLENRQDDLKASTNLSVEVEKLKDQVRKLKLEVEIKDNQVRVLKQRLE
jgi:archaellum component FlaC